MDRREMMVLGLCIWQFVVVPVVLGTAVFRVEHRFQGVRRSLKELRGPDVRRHSRLLGNIDMPLGGDSSATSLGLYYTKIQLGNPASEFHVQVDTGSDIMWVHCSGCEGCPQETRAKHIQLQAYDPKSSSSAKVIKCDHQYCATVYQRSPASCKPDMLCQFEVNYGDGSATAGYFVEDSIIYKLSGNHSLPGNGTVFFGCGTKAGQTDAPLAVDGIMGFGQANSSVLSQLAAAGKVKKKFSHCLDNKRGGGILAVGELAEPKLNSSPIVQKQVHYNIVLESIDVDGDVQEFSKGWFSKEKGAIIDSGATLAYFPGDIYDRILRKIFSKPGLEVQTVQGSFKCFAYAGDIDTDFPKIIMNFKGSLTLIAYPHEYLFKHDGFWCLGLQPSTFEAREGDSAIIVGDILLQNRLVYYDLENQTLGWTEYDCASSIKLKDEQSGNVHNIDAQNLSLADSLVPGRSLLLLAFLLTLINLLFTIHY